MLTTQDKTFISSVIDATRARLTTLVISKVGRLTFRFHEFEKHLNIQTRELEATLVRLTARVRALEDRLDQLRPNSNHFPTWPPQDHP